MPDDNVFNQGSQMSEKEYNYWKYKAQELKDQGKFTEAENIEGRINIDNSNIHDGE
jgi:hypothetical protein